MRLLLSISCVALMFSSCKKPLNDTQRKINNGINITMTQEERSLKLHVATNENFACSNNAIELSYSTLQMNGKGSLDVWYVQTQKDCLPPGGPATADIEVGRLRPGKYDLILSYNNKKKHRVTFIATESKYTATNTKDDFFSFTNTEVSLQ